MAQSGDSQCAVSRYRRTAGGSRTGFVQQVNR